MTEQGKIINVNNDRVTIKATRKSDCGSCHLCEEKSNDSFVLEAFNPGGLDFGDHVKIEIHEKKMIQGTLIIYGFPLLGLFIGFFIGNIISKLIGSISYKELTIAVTGFSVFFLSFFLIKYFYKKNSKSLMATVIEKVDKNNMGSRKDPVCGMSVPLDHPSGTAIFQGKTYLFCSIHCKEIFDENPKKYI